MKNFVLDRTLTLSTKFTAFTKCFFSLSSGEGGCVGELVSRTQAGEGSSRNAAFTLAQGGRRPLLNSDTRHAAFTLAEVLITLAIIGIVAAITIPPLTQNYKRKVASTRLKKFYSSMQQAIQLSEIENGNLFSWEIAPYRTGVSSPGDDIFIANSNAALDFFEKYLAKYINHSKTERATTYKSMVYFADGSILYLLNGAIALDIKYDVNGMQGPNKNGIDQFAFFINSRANNFLGNRKFTGFYGDRKVEDFKTRDQALEVCKTSEGYSCTPLLELFDNWEFKKDYPFKF